jgi:hypothetical protein
VILICIFLLTLYHLYLTYSPSCSMSLKDKGNDEVKKGNLEKAIEYYEKYVE